MNKKIITKTFEILNLRAIFLLFIFFEAHFYGNHNFFYLFLWKQVFLKKKKFFISRSFFDIFQYRACPTALCVLARRRLADDWGTAPPTSAAFPSSFPSPPHLPFPSRRRWVLYSRLFPGRCSFFREERHGKRGQVAIKKHVK